MAKYCASCGAKADDGSFFCSECGALLPQSGAAVQAAPAEESLPAEESGRVRTPQTIDELLAFCERHKLPLAKMRFFIGLDYPGARAFGIFRDADGQFVVYKNKADGSRAVRYRGPDEAYAVHEIFEKLKSEATVQRAHAASKKNGYTPPETYTGENGAAPSSSGKKRKSSRLLIFLLAAAAAITIGRTVAHIRPQIQPGYYSYGGNTYYSQQDNWYIYDDGLDYWYPVSVEDELQNNAENYYESYSYNADYGVSDFAESDYYDYDAGSSSDWDWDWDDDDDWDSGSDWDWDSDWDSDFSDWDSDW